MAGSDWQRTDLPWNVLDTMERKPALRGLHSIARIFRPKRITWRNDSCAIVTLGRYPAVLRKSERQSNAEATAASVCDTAKTEFLNPRLSGHPLKSERLSLRKAGACKACTFGLAAMQSE